jgi:hypothetical protein
MKRRDGSGYTRQGVRRFSPEVEQEIVSAYRAEPNTEALGRRYGCNARTIANVVAVELEA